MAQIPPASLIPTSDVNLLPTDLFYGFAREKAYLSRILNKNSFYVTHRNRKVHLSGMAWWVMQVGKMLELLAVIFLLLTCCRRADSCFWRLSKGGIRDYVVLFVAPVSEKWDISLPKCYLIVHGREALWAVSGLKQNRRLHYELLFVQTWETTKCAGEASGCEGKDATEKNEIHLQIISCSLLYLLGKVWAKSI